MARVPLIAWMRDHVAQTTLAGVARDSGMRVWAEIGIVDGGDNDSDAA